MSYRNDPYNDFERRLVVDEIKIEEGKNSRMVLEVTVDELKALTSYWLEFGQPIPEKCEALPIYIQVKCGKPFAKRVTVDDDECECGCDYDHGYRGENKKDLIPCDGDKKDCSDDEYDPNLGYGYPQDKYGYGHYGRKFRKTIPVSKYGLGNVAFGEDVLGRGRGDYPRRRLKVYLTNDARFTLLPRGH